jgi:hypothetical protein
MKIAEGLYLGQLMVFFIRKSGGAALPISAREMTGAERRKELIGYIAEVHADWCPSGTSNPKTPLFCRIAIVRIITRHYAAPRMNSSPNNV